MGFDEPIARELAYLIGLAAPVDSGTRVARDPLEVPMANSKTEDVTVVPIPGEENEAERKRIRKSNDRDQEKERHGEPARHNEGYDEAADGIAQPEIARVIDE